VDDVGKRVSANAGKPELSGVTTLAFNRDMPRRLPHDFDHQHPDVTGGWLRAATFGAMDGLVSNTALVAGVAAGAGASTVVLAGVAGLLAGAFSMALGEYTSVTTANEQIDAEVRVEKRAFKLFPEAEQREMTVAFEKMGLSAETARQAAEELHRDKQQALRIHLVTELGVDPTEKPSPKVAAVSSFLMFCIGAIIPLIPYLLGFESLPAGLICGGIGLMIAGAMAAHFTKQPLWFGGARQLLFGSIAIGATYVVGLLVGQVV
jgi:VIT1/CCC1 family predicted Fe2+/Mn2+ transporter